MKRRILAIITCLCLTISLAATAFAAASGFSDVSGDAYYYDAVQWAVENEVTVGTSATTFSPNDSCTRAQIVTFLWRAAGSPAPTLANCDFTDVSKSAYYYDAVLWAVENGITSGTSATSFSPNDFCTRAQVVTFLYRAAGAPDVDLEGAIPFTDVAAGDYFCAAVLWAVENGVTKGTSATIFSPYKTVTRAETVTFLYRADDIEPFEPQEPTTAPTEPATEPTEPATEPTEPATEPTEPATEPTEPPTEPTEPTEPVSDVTYFTFYNDEITVSGNTDTAYKIVGTALSINGAGTYSVSGVCRDGSITVKKGTTGVTLILNNLTLTSTDTAPIACNKSTAVTIVAAAGTENTLIDSEQNNDETYPDNANAENAVIKCKDGSQVTICGTGTINVIANGKNGVKGGATTESEGEAWLTVKELTLNITANANDGLKSDQELNVLSGNITISAVDDGIKSDLVLNIGQEGADGPMINIVKSNEGIEAATLNVYSGNITVHATDDGMNAANSDLTGYGFSLNIYGGTLYVDAENGDGIDSNGSLTLAGGVVTVFSSSQNDNAPLDCDGKLTLTGGTVLAVGSGGMAQTPNSATQHYLSFGAGGGHGAPGGPGGPGGGGPGGGWNPGQPGQGGVSIPAGSTITVQDASGKTLYTAAAIRQASYVFFTSADLLSGQTYTLLVNGSAAASATAK